MGCHPVTRALSFTAFRQAERGLKEANEGLEQRVIERTHELFDILAGSDQLRQQIEGGVKWEPQALPLQATLAYYTLEEKNRLANDPNNPVGPSVQLGKADIRGVELETRSDVGPWSVLGSYTYTRVRATATAFGGEGTDAFAGSGGGSQGRDDLGAQ